eukprot:1180003-Prorocentrum_minimum.AAC.3
MSSATRGGGDARLGRGSQEGGSLRASQPGREANSEDCGNPPTREAAKAHSSLADRSLFAQVNSVLSDDDNKTPDFGSASSGALPNGFDLLGTKLTYAPLAPVAGDPNLGYKVACKDEIGEELPYTVRENSGGAPRADSGAQRADSGALKASNAFSPVHSDDSSREASFTGGKTFTFFGTEYTSVWVGSNGYVTFGRGDWMYYSHRYYHYRMPRISGAFYDLNPRSSPGSITYAQTEQSMVITYTDIKTYSGNYLNTFQVYSLSPSAIGSRCGYILSPLAGEFGYTWADALDAGAPLARALATGAAGSASR